MATIGFAMWLQNADPDGTRRLLLLAFGVMAVAIAVMAVILAAIAVKAMKVIQDVKTTADEVKLRLLPVLDEVLHISRASREILEDAAPKVKIISENLVKTSESLVESSKIARAAVQRIDGTITDANMRTQRQVARVDGMVTAALTTTQEVADTIVNGIKVPAQKLAVMLTQAKFAAEGLLAKARGMAANSPFGARSRPE
jgi:D-ribose pyranose/furanose isomerase RbsD